MSGRSFRRVRVGGWPRRFSGAALALLISAACLGPAFAADKPVAYSGPKWGSWLEFGGSWSSERSRGEAILWSPVWQGPQSLLFLDLRGKLFEEDVREGNFAVGFRHMLPSGWNVGAWAGYDVRHSENGNSFDQASFGVEALSANFDLRANAYLPLSGPKAGGNLTEVVLTGPQIFMTGGREVPLRGFDATAGMRLPLLSESVSQSARHDFWLYAGGFWFDHSDALRRISGPSARFEWRIEDVLPALPGSRFTFEAGVRHDQVRDTVWEVGARLRIPFGHGLGAPVRTASLTAQERRMSERLERDTDIITTRSGAEAVRDVATGVRFDRVAYVGGGGSITDTSKAAGANSLLIVNGKVEGRQRLRGNQTLQGGGASIQVQGVESGAVRSFTAPGAKGRLFNDRNSTALTLLGDNTHVAGFQVRGSNNCCFIDNHGVFADSGLNNIVIEQMDIARMGGIGIAMMDGNSGILIRDVKIENSRAGILFDEDNRNLTIENARIRGVDVGMTFFEGNRNITILNPVVRDVFDGIHFGAFNRNIAIENPTIRQAFTGGIVFEFRNRDVVVTGGTIGRTSAGVALLFDNRDMRFENILIEEAIAGVFLGAENRDIAVTGANIRNVGEGITAVDSNRFSVSNTVIRNTLFNGISAVTGNRISISNTRFSNVDANAIYIADDNRVRVNNSVFAGNIAVDGIFIQGMGNRLNGSGNSAAGATFGGDLCNDLGNAWSGTVLFDGAPITAANCP